MNHSQIIEIENLFSVDNIDLSEENKLRMILTHLYIPPIEEIPKPSSEPLPIEELPEAPEVENEQLIKLKLTLEKLTVKIEEFEKWRKQTSINLKNSLETLKFRDIDLSAPLDQKGVNEYKKIENGISENINQFFLDKRYCHHNLFKIFNKNKSLIDHETKSKIQNLFRLLEDIDLNHYREFIKPFANSKNSFPKNSSLFDNTIQKINSSFLILLEKNQINNIQKIKLVRKKKKKKR